MAECCGAGRFDSDGPIACVGCRTTGKRVDSLTVKALLTESALRRFESATYFFCPDPGCDISYFAENGPSFSKDDVRVAIWQKAPAGQRVICYCFGENERDIASEIHQSGLSLAVDRIRAHIRAGRCACEARNPRGACCLSDVAAAVDRLREALVSETRRA
jgi:hypothetical protein